VTAAHAGAALMACAHLAQRAGGDAAADAQAWRSLGGLWAERLPAAALADAAGGCWAAAKLGRRLPPGTSAALLERLEALAAAPPGGGGGAVGAAAKLAWALARLGARSPALWRAAGALLRREARRLNFRMTANGLWALATAEPAGATGAADALADRAEALLAAAAGTAGAAGAGPNMQDVGNTAWAVAKLQLRRPALLAALAAAGAELVRDGAPWRPLNAANLLWALAKAGQHEDPAFEALTPALAGRLAGCEEPETVAQLAWALARARRAAPGAFAAVAERAGALAGAAGGRELAQLAWALGEAGQPAPRFYATLAARIAGGGGGAAVDSAHPPTLSFGGPGEAAELLWALCRAGRAPPPVFAALLSAALRGGGVARLMPRVRAAACLFDARCCWSRGAALPGGRLTAGRSPPLSPPKKLKQQRRRCPCWPAAWRTPAGRTPPWRAT